MITKLELVFALLFIAGFTTVFGQAPNISYTSPQVYTVGIAITPLAPTDTGGAVPTSTPFALTGSFNNLTGIAVDASGNVYVAENGASDVREIPAGGGAPITLGAGFDGPTGVAVDGAGNVYVADFYTNGIKKIPAGNGSVVSIVGGLSGPYGVAVDAAGNLYVSEFYGGDVKKIAAGGGTPAVIASGFNNPTGVTIDATGNVYVTDRGNNAIKKISAGSGNVVTLSGGNGNPNSVAVDSFGNVYFADTNLNTITKIPVGGGSNIAIGSGFVTPTCVAVDAKGDIFIGDNGNSVVKEIAIGGYKISPDLPAGLSLNTGTGVISGTPTVASVAANYTVTATNSSGSSSAMINITVNLPPKPIISYDTPQVFIATEAISSFSPVSSGGPIPASGAFSINPALPSGLSFDINTGTISGTPSGASPAANYTVTATNIGGSGTAIIKITVKPYPVPTISYSTPQTYPVGFAITPLSPSAANVGAAGSRDTVSLGSGFINFRGVAVDASGNVYIAEDGNNDVREILAGGGAPITIGSGFISPTGVAVDGLGNVYVADNGNNAVKKIPAGNGPVVTVATGFNGPYGIALDAAGNIYVGDAANNQVKKIPSGTNTPVVIGSGFNHPTGVAVDASGNVYVTDRGNNAIKKILASNGATVTLGQAFGNPNGVAVDPAGNVYFADTQSAPITEIPVGGGGDIQIGSFSNPVAVAVDVADPNIFYVGSNGDGHVEKVTPTGGYFISPALPPGLVLSSGTGTISGTPAAVSPATDYTVKAYNIGGPGSATVNLSVYNTNSGLANLSLSSGTLSPVFATAVTSYTVNEANGTASITVTPTASQPSNTIAVNGSPVASGSASQAISLTIGANPVSIVVTSQGGQILGNYTVSVYRSPSTNDNLSALSVSAGTLMPAFSSATTSYKVFVSDAISNFSVTPVTADANATITVDNQPVASGSVSTPVPLSEGTNTIPVGVTAQDGTTTQSYIITVIRSSNDNLSALTVSAGALSPAFSSGVTSYSDNVDNAASIAVTPTTSDPGATVAVNGIVVSSGGASAPIPLTTGTNTISVVVTAPDGITTQTYSITIIRAASSDAYLSNLKATTATLSPAFAFKTFAYTSSVPSTTSSVTLTPSLLDATASVTVNGTPAGNKTASAPIALAVGANTINIAVTAQDGTTMQTYTVTITRPPSTVATLSSLQTSGGTLSPVFAGGITSYTATVATTTTSITITPATTDAGATVTVNGKTVVTNTASGAINLAIGANTITTVVTAQDGVTKQTYTITVTRDAVGTNNAYLSNLKVTTAALSPAFAFKTFGYSSNVANSVSSVTVTPTLLDATASVTVNGIVVANKTASGPIPLAIGANTITITVTAQDGITTQSYTVTIARPPSIIATLSNLQLSSETLTPVFVSNITSYAATVATTTTSITVTPVTTDASATVTVNGKAVASNAASGAINLAIGANTITTVVTAQDGVTQQTYTLTVTRDAAGTNNAYLSNLKITTATLSPAFAFKTLAYTSNVPNSTSSVTVTPSLLDATASVMVNGAAVANKTASTPIALAIGTNAINVVVTARDGITTNSYTVTITRAAGGADGYPPAISVTKPGETPVLADDGIQVHQGISPNGDGVNDFLQIDNITQYPDNKLSVMNRDGQLIYEATGYDNSSKLFDGHSNKNKKMQLPGTYFYQLDYTVNGTVKHKTGFIVLKY